MDAILVVNAGSSSLKFQVFRVASDNDLECTVRGQIEGVGRRPRLRAAGPDRQTQIDREYTVADVPDVPAAIGLAGKWLRETQIVELIAVGHRVVHGGPVYSKPVLLDARVLADLDRYVPLAPLHQPHNLAPIRSLLESRPDLPQVACFDTAFHRGHAPVADCYAIPEHLYVEGVRRFGFHGLSYEYVADKLHQIAPKAAKGRTIIAHLGSGASMCALFEGRSVESTMGFTALDGLPMGTRPGQIDPGVVLYLLSEKGMAPAEVQDFLYRECGLKGLSGVSNDVRELEQSSNPRAALTLDYFVYRVGLFAGMLAASLQGLDAFVFTAGIGENSPTMRARIASKLTWLGATLDEEANAAGRVLISLAESRVALHVIPTDEERMIAQHTLALIQNTRSTGTPPKGDRLTRNVAP